MNNWRIDQTIDLQRQEAAAYPAYGRASLGDSEAHTWAVTVTDGGAPVDLNGVSVVVSAVNSQGQTIPATGAISGNVATAVLPAECYALTGLVRCTMRLVAVGRTITSAYLEINVTRADTTTVIDPGDVVPNLAELIAAVPAANAAIKAAQIAANMGAGLNLLYNSGFYSGVDGWTLPSFASRDATKNMFGANAVKFQRTGQPTDSIQDITPTNQYWVPCTAGDTFTASAWLYMDNYSTVDSTDPIFVSVIQYNAFSIQVTSNGTYLTPTIANNNRWTKITVTVTITDPSTAFVVMRMRIRRNATVWWACPKLERGSVATDWRPSWADILALPYPGAWITPTLLNGWASGGYTPVFYKDASSIVRFKGRLATADAGTTIFELPAGYRPANNSYFIVARGDSPTAIARIMVYADGRVQCNTTISPASFIDLSGVFYRAEA